jgi:hypothetical protein
MVQMVSGNSGDVGVRIGDGSTNYGSTELKGLSGAEARNFVLSAMVVLAAPTTVKIQGYSTRAGALFKSASPLTGSGNNATQLMALKLA